MRKAHDVEVVDYELVDLGEHLFLGGGLAVSVRRLGLHYYF